jgi:hypothetical protein
MRRESGSSGDRASPEKRPTAARSTKVVSSLVFHQVQVDEKKAGIATMSAAANAGGTICIADYAQ